jgi:hypothetical protein
VGERKPVSSLITQLEARSDNYLEQCLRILPSGERHTVWSRLYAASERLRQALDENGVADAVLEIGSNLLGCEEMAVVELHAKGASVSILASVGITEAQRSALVKHAAKISSETADGRVRIVDKRLAADEFLANLGITALVPLSQSTTVNGAIIMFNLLPQRKGFESGDRELLGLLSVYVGPGLFGLSGAVRKERR